MSVKMMNKKSVGTKSNKKELWVQTNNESIAKNSRNAGVLCFAMDPELYDKIGGSMVSLLSNLDVVCNVSSADKTKLVFSTVGPRKADGSPRVTLGFWNNVDAPSAAECTDKCRAEWAQSVKDSLSGLTADNIQVPMSTDEQAAYFLEAVV